MSSTDMLNTAPRGTKRKRLGGPQRTSTHKHARVERAAPAPGELVARKLHHGVHEVRKAAKKAVAFELRKVVKRLKQARTPSVKPKGEDAAELERQLEVLKNADHEQFADTALRTKVLKDKLLAPNADVAAALAEKLAAAGPVAPQASGSAAAKVHGRLLSSKTVAEAVRAVVDGLREAVDPSLAKGRKEKEKAAGGKGDEEGSGDSEDDDDDDDEDEDEDDELVGRPAKGKKSRLVAGGARGGGSDSEEAVDDAGWESGTVDGDEDGWESGSIDGADNGIGVAASSDEEDDEDAEDDEDGESSSSGADLRPKTKPAAKDAKGKTKAASTGGGSTFLPSLSVGFTRGDSDASDLSDGEAEAADVPRKNRRGQRARRAIWEKKYGRNANHVKSNQQQQQQEQQQRPPNRGRAGHDPRQQPQPHNRHGGAGAGAHLPQQRQGGQGPPRGARDAHGSGGRRSDMGWSTRAGASASAREETALHPSWEAKRKLKEKLNPSIVPAQGKKITF